MQKVESNRNQAKPKGRPRSFDREKALETALRLFWQLGYEPASVSGLCKAIGINPPSFYAAFGSKSQLFIEAVQYYEEHYWSGALKRLEQAEEPVADAVDAFFEEAADILLNPENPAGCMVVLAAVNVSADEREISELVRTNRRDTRAFFARRLLKAAQKGELKEGTDVEALADILNIILEGMSIQARDGMDLATLKRAVREAGAVVRAHGA